MADYCSNKLEFLGANSQLAVDHFSEMGYDSPPFQDVLIDNDFIYFESRWIPPLRDLQQIAEQFDVDFQLVYQLPGERAKEKYSYICLKNQSLDGHAGELKEKIGTSTSIADLELVAESVHSHADRSLINNNERTILAHLAEKRYNELADELQQQNEDLSVSKRKPGR